MKVRQTANIGVASAATSAENRRQATQRPDGVKKWRRAGISPRLRRGRRHTHLALFLCTGIKAGRTSGANAVVGVTNSISGSNMGATAKSRYGVKNGWLTAATLGGVAPWRPAAVTAKTA
jgi:hypothetical protein